ncbi:MAG TPA: hypothetical protein PKM44_12070, partial [Turneriella sp.]|nr:hypothetical protein [Turneriella sp.]
MTKTTALKRFLRALALLLGVCLFLVTTADAARRKKGRAKPRKAAAVSARTATAEESESESLPVEAAGATEGSGNSAVVVSSSNDEIVPGSGSGVVAEGEAPGAAKGAPTLLITGFVDMGFAFAQNKGVGFQKDVGNNFQQFADKTAVFVGDPASTYMNTRHEAHDLGEAGNFPLAFDGMQGKGNPMGALNSATIDMIAEIHENVRLQVSTEFLPRQPVVQNQTGMGSFVNLDMAFLDWKPLSQYDITVTAGKFIGITGIEYRWRRAPDRWTVTPTLVGRYMDGNPLG